MSLLMDIAPSVQQVADAISIAVGVEVEIVDEGLTIIGGTSIYQDRIGMKEEAGQLDGNYLYARVLRSGTTEYIADTEQYLNYGTSLAPAEGKELAEICTPIKNGDYVLGIIGLVAMNEAQKSILIDKDRSMVSFIEKMADLLSAKATLKALLTDTESSRNEMATVLESTHEGIFALDSNGYIRHCNHISEELFSTNREEIIGSHISRFMRGTPALAVLKSGNGYTEREEIYKTYKGTYHFIVTTKPYYKSGQIAGVVISFRDIEEAKKLAYNINTSTLKYTFDDIIGESEVMKHVKNRAMLTARGDSTVLITGESGTGKEMFAKAIHYTGLRDDKPFITVNCGAIPENLLESELFGYEKGAFTGASEKGKKGKFELAHGGTIFLDEIGDMPLHLQVKILHVLQNMKFEKIGGDKTINVDVRVIAATNRDLEDLIEKGEFREDLYYRLSVIPLTTPPLRDRRDDVCLLMMHFLKKYNTFMGKSINGFSEEAKSIFRSYDWPGNVRELENAIEYGVNMSYSDEIDIDAIPERMLRDSDMMIDNDETIGMDVVPDERDLSLNDQVKKYEKRIIMNKLEKYGNSSNAKDKLAKELGLSRATLYRKLAELDI